MCMKAARNAKYVVKKGSPVLDRLKAISDIVFSRDRQILSDVELYFEEVIEKCEALCKRL